MATNGNESKKMIFTKLQEIFPDSFVYGKELRINLMENGEKIQIKVVLTKSKTIVDAGADIAVPGEKVEIVTGLSADGPVTAQRTEMREPTEAEKKNISNLLAELGL